MCLFSFKCFVPFRLIYEAENNTISDEFVFEFIKISLEPSKRSTSNSAEIANQTCNDYLLDIPNLQIEIECFARKA